MNSLRQPLYEILFVIKLYDFYRLHDRYYNILSRCKISFLKSYNWIKEFFLGFLFIMFIFSFFSACGISNNTFKVSEKAYRINIKAGHKNNEINLKAVSSFRNDTCYINIFGPLGINVSKICALRDSLTFVDLYNKTIYEGVYPGASLIFQDLLEGKLDNHDRFFFSSILDHFFNVSQYSFHESLLKIEFKNGLSKRYVYFNFVSGLDIFFVNLTVRKDKSGNSMNFDKQRYISFKKSIIYLK